jgi:hypothetical protein
MSRAPFPKGGTPPWWWKGYQPSWDAQTDLRHRLAWLYGDPEARKTANAGDVEAWRRLGRRA